MIHIKKISVVVDNKKIINDFSLTVNSGEIIYLVGKNGAGKSSLALSIIGHPDYNVTGEIIIEDQNILDLPIYKRSLAGVFVSMQYPTDLPGVSTYEFLREIYKSHYNTVENFDYILSEIESIIDFSVDNIKNIQGLSGGQKKRFELLQLCLLKPKFIVLDEIDSGMDQDGIKTIKKVIEYLKKKNNPVFLIISHSQEKELFGSGKTLFLENGLINE